MSSFYVTYINILVTLIFDRKFLQKIWQNLYIILSTGKICKSDFFANFSEIELSTPIEIIIRSYISTSSTLSLFMFMDKTVSFLSWACICTYKIRKDDTPYPWRLQCAIRTVWIHDLNYLYSRSINRSVKIVVIIIVMVWFLLLLFYHSILEIGWKSVQFARKDHSLAPLVLSDGCTLSFKKIYVGRLVNWISWKSSFPGTPEFFGFFSKIE